MSRSLKLLWTDIWSFTHYYQEQLKRFQYDLLRKVSFQRLWWVWKCVNDLWMQRTVTVTGSIYYAHNLVCDLDNSASSLTPPGNGPSATKQVQWTQLQCETSCLDSSQDHCTGFFRSWLAWLTQPSSHRLPWFSLQVKQVVWLSGKHVAGDGSQGGGD